MLSHFFGAGGWTADHPRALSHQMSDVSDYNFEDTGSHGGSAFRLKHGGGIKGRSRELQGGVAGHLGQIMAVGGGSPSPGCTIIEACPVRLDGCRYTQIDRRAKTVY